MSFILTVEQRTKERLAKLSKAIPWFIFWIGDQMVLVVVMKGQQEALIPLAWVQTTTQGQGH